MFKKPFKVKSNSQLRVSDRKKLQLVVCHQFPQLTEEVFSFILPIKEAIFQLKVLSHLEQPVTIYCLKKLPMLFEIKNTMYPTIYMLWNVQDLLYTFTTHPEVMQFLARGADLMLPGVVMPEGKEVETYGALKKGDRVAVNLTTNRAAVAVGITANSSYKMCAKKGKCVEILHCYGDHLTTYGPNLVVPELGPVIENKARIKCLPTPDFQYLAKITGKVEGSSVKIGNFPKFDNETSKLESEFETRVETSGTEIQLPSDPGFKEEHNCAEHSKDCDSSNLSMNYILKYCFIKSLKNTIKNVKLPILTCNFYKLHMIPMCPKGRNLEIKNTSYKKLSTFLNEMADMGVIKVESLQKGVQSITKIDHDNEMLKEFVDRFGNKDEVNNSLEKKSSPPQITEKYIVTAAVLPLFQAYNFKNRMSLTASEVQKVVEDYVKVKIFKTAPMNKMGIVLDHVLKKAANSLEDNEILSMNELMSRILAQMGNSYKVEKSCNKGIEIKGKLQPIDIRVGTRSGNKKVTLVNNLEVFGINLTEFSKECQHGAAASTTINTLPFAKSLQLQIQGNQVLFVGKLLMEKYKIPMRYLRGLENASKKKN